MDRSVRGLILAVSALSLFSPLACDGGGDEGLPTRRAEMRVIKLSTDRIAAVLKNESLEGVEEDAKKIRRALHAVTELYPPEHKEKYRAYSKEAQNLAIELAIEARANDVKNSNWKFRGLVPYCGKCHEDCAFLLAPAFPEYDY